MRQKVTIAIALAVASMLGVGAAVASGTGDSFAATSNSGKPGPDAAPDWTLVQAGHLLAIPGQAALEARTLVIHQGRIVRILQGFAGPDSVPEAVGKSVRTIDLQGAYVLPGLIDAHVHLSEEHTLNNVWEERSKIFRDTDEYRGILTARHAETELQHGFTTVRGAGDNTRATFSLRRAAHDGYALAPRILTAGPLIGVTGSQDDPDGYPFRESIRGLFRSEQTGVVCNGAESCRQAARYTAAQGAEWVKILASGGVEVLLPGHSDPLMSEDEIAAIVRSAHELRLHVMAHAISTESVKRCLRAGVDSIEHGSRLDDEAIALFKKTGAFFVPTLVAVAEWAKAAPNSRGVTPEQAAAIRERAFEGVQRAYHAGVPIVLGSDVGYVAHESGSEEFILLQEAGLTAGDAIRAGTVVAARLLGLEGEVGTLEPGKSADLVAVAHNPLADIREMTHVGLVMQGGTVRFNEQR